jgi:hypothetical protein
MLEFYEMMINIRKWDTNQVINILNNIIKKEEKLINNYTTDYEGLCKVFATNLYSELIKLGFIVNEVNISDIYKELKEHVFLILSYQDLNSKFNYILIDPTYRQFCKKKGVDSPFYFEAWPSEILKNINPNLLKTLLDDKYCYIDDKNLQDYLSSFTNKKVDISLENILLNKYKEGAKIR